MTSHDPPPTKAVGVPDMENEHRVLHELLHELKRALSAGRKDAVSELPGRFEDTANLHFVEEQSLMRLHAYPGYAAHQQEHDELVAELGELSRRIRAGEFADATQAAAGLESWLMTHMETTDAALETYLEDQGIRPGHPDGP